MSQRAVVFEPAEPGVYGHEGCGLSSTWPVCSKLEGNTTQGLCDMAGNVAEWVGDEYCTSYETTPRDGTAAMCDTAVKVFRGGAWSLEAENAKATFRHAADGDGENAYPAVIGIRLVRDVQ
jgi:formylglycine-generating enzyme required for sulfatase activity